MTHKEILKALAEALRRTKTGRPAEMMALDLQVTLLELGVELRAKPRNSAERKAERADEHDRWADAYEVQAAQFDDQGLTVAAESRRKMALESRERAAILRGQGPVRA